MINLVIDQGNSFIKYAIFANDDIVENGYCTKIQGYDIVYDLIQRYDIHHAILSNTSSLSPKLLKILKGLPFFLRLSVDTSLPIDIEYETVSTLGRDRIAGAVACHKLFPNEASIFIDMGTCITKNIINDKGIFLGGNISPGIEMRLKAMNYFTDKLPLVELKIPKNEIGKSTMEALQNGAIRGAVEEIEKFIDVQKTQFERINVILTGGSAHFFDNLSNIQIFAAPFLVLTGLNEILKYNVEKK